MGRRNAALELRVIDPDREPTLARSYGVRIYNAGVLEAEDRKLLVQTTDENEVALGIQRVLRERVVTVCFLEGHGELPMDNFEFHTHLEGVAGHSHGDASSQYVQMPGHGIGRLRRALEAQGYVTRRVILATTPAVPDDCQVLIAANPRTTFLPAESAALDACPSRDSPRCSSDSACGCRRRRWSIRSATTLATARWSRSRGTARRRSRAACR